MVVFGFAIGRFAIAIRQFMQIQGRVLPTAGFSVWLGTVAIIAGVFLSLAGLFRYRKTKHQLELGRFEPAGFLVDLIGILTALLGLALAGHLIYIELSLREAAGPVANFRRRPPPTSLEFRRAPLCVSDPW